jgi:protease-4
MAVYNKPEDALKYKLVDGLKYKDEILSELKQRTGIGRKKILPVLTWAIMLKAAPRLIPIKTA